MKAYVLMQNYPVFIVQCLPHDPNSWDAKAASVLELRPDMHAIGSKICTHLFSCYQVLPSGELLHPSILPSDWDFGSSQQRWEQPRPWIALETGQAKFSHEK